MKTIEQKAKAYDEAIKRGLDYIRHTPATEMVTRQDIFEAIFPEFKESEDEKTRKAIINFLKSPFVNENITDEKVAPWLAWLEKQGEQKPVDDNPKQELIDNIGPKFKVGDWIARNYQDSGTFIYKVVDVKKINDESYGYKLDDGTYFSGSWKDVYHLWSIADAKEGDILYSPEHNLLWIYKNKEECYAAVNLNYSNSISFGTDIVMPSDAQPATKSQCDYIFSEMYESGYEWDGKEKELKKIEDEEYDGEDYGIDSLWHAHRILEKTLGEVDGYQTDDGILSHKCAITAVKKLYEQKPAEWSEKDEKMVGNIRSMIEKYAISQSAVDVNGELCDKTYIDVDNWLKALKQRHTWKPSSELDEASYQVGIKRVLENPESYGLTKYNWKPSNEQLYVLHWLATNVLGDGVVDKKASEILYTLYDDLKKLQEE